MIITTQDLQELIVQKKPHTLIDIREKHEYAHGTLPGAVCVPLHDVLTYLENHNLVSPIIVYCRSGGRSQILVQKAKGRGIPLTDYSGGILAWSKIDENVNAY